MPYSLSPNVLAVTQEATNFTQTVNIALTMGDPAITSLVIIPAANTNGDFTFTNSLTLDPTAPFNANTFTISGQYNNNFVASLKYLDNNKEEKTIESKTIFQELPSEYFTVVEYLASYESNFTATFNVTINGNIIGTVTQQVNNNYTPGRDSLIAAVAGGQV